jgi:RNA polymerase primary sigma factor
MKIYVDNFPLEATEKEFAEITEPGLLGSQAGDLEIGEAESPAIEMPLERLEEQEVIDDPVRMYLREIGRVKLLTAGEERSLAKQRERGRRIGEIKKEWLKKQLGPPSATEIMLVIIKNVYQSISVIDLIQK